MKLKLATALLVPAALVSVAACGGSHPAKVKGTFPVCHTDRMAHGVVVYDTDKVPCVVKNASGLYTVHATASPLHQSGLRSPYSPTYTPPVIAKTKAPVKSLKK